MTNHHEHTPGPWHYEVSGNCDSMFTLTDDFRTQLAEVERWNYDDDAEVMAHAEANARLVAAAPDPLAFAAL